MLNSKILFFALVIATSCNQKRSSNTNSVGFSRENIDTSFSMIRNHFLDADTVLLVGHLGLLGDFPKPDDTLPLIVTSGKLNYPIIKKQKISTKTEIDTLLSILSKPDGEYLGLAKCGWNPHHSIVLIKNGHYSYIDMCFSCQQFGTSDDLKYFHHFSGEKWNELEDFFKDNGVRYNQYQKKP